MSERVHFSKNLYNPSQKVQRPELKRIKIHSPRLIYYVCRHPNREALRANAAMVQGDYCAHDDPGSFCSCVVLGCAQ
jgi:hypothetical protein